MTSIPGQSIEAFGELMARLDDPFSDRAEVLRGAALDEDALQRLEERFAKELASESEEPARRFGDAYEATVSAIAAIRGGDQAAPDLRFLNADAQPFREEAAAVLREPMVSAPVEPRAEAPAAVVAPRPPVDSAAFSAAPLLSAPAPAPRSVDVAWIPEGMRGFTDLRGTQLATNADVPKGPALPFNPNAAPTLSAQPSTSRAPFIPAGMRGFTSVHGTQLAEGGPVGSALPFPGTDRSKAAIPARVEAPGSSFPQLSVEQYASLYVELAALPGRSTEVLDRYRITEEQRRQLDAHWAARMVADPALRQAWDSACNAYKAWLARSKGER
jgi:hypothetical protein